MNLRQKKKLGKLKEVARFTDFKSSSNWCSGICGKYRFEAKLYDEGSCFGINEGRVSKLHIWPKEGFVFDSEVVAYDRGWDIEPTQKTRNVYNKIMQLLENSPKRFS